MNTVTSPELQKAKRLASTAHVLAILALVAIGIHIAVRVGPAIGNALFNDTTPWRQEINSILLIVVSLLPAGLFYEAINQLRRALRVYSEGEFFSSLASSRVAQAGDYAVSAMISVMLIVPTLTRWMLGGHSFKVRIEPEFLGMLALALFVSAVGRMLAAAAQIKAENESFV